LPACRSIQVCVQLPTCADNVALPAFARRTPLLQSIDISAPRQAHSSKPTVAGLLLWVHAGTERRTDGWTFGRTPRRFIDAAPHCMRTVPIIQVCVDPPRIRALTLPAYCCALEIPEADTDRYLPPAPRLLQGCCCYRSTGRTGRQTDTVPLRRRSQLEAGSVTRQRTITTCGTDKSQLTYRALVLQLNYLYHHLNTVDFLLNNSLQ